MTSKYLINSWLWLIALLFASAHEAISAADLFVSTTGNDTNIASQQSPVATIQRGIALASNGDTVWVNQGTYSGEGNRNIDLMGKAVNVKSVAGPKSVTLDLQQNRAFLANSSESLATVIDGFTIVGGYAITGQDWGGIGIISINYIASLTIKNCIFTNNKVEISYFTARANIIEDYSNSGSVIENCLFYGNTCRGGYWMTTSFSSIIWGRNTNTRFLTVANNYLESNSWFSWSPGGLPVSVGDISGSFKSSIVRGNTNINSHCVYSGTAPSYSMTDGIIIDAISGAPYSLGYTQIDPLFANPQNGDFSLASGSPAIDAGDPSVVDPDGTRSDIGFNLARAQPPRSQIMSFTATTGGTITGAGEYDPGSTATLTATPDAGYAFTAWTGDASGTTNPLTLTMDVDKTVGATFAADLSDADADGLTAYDEVTLYHTDPTKADSDNDGLTDAYELGIGRFSVISGTRTWAQAKAHAETQGGTLATFANQDEWNLAMQSIGSDALVDVGGLWIGATDEVLEGTWAWVTGEPFVFTLWETGQPDNGSNSDYAAVAGDLGGASGKWYDYRAATTRDGYIFESGYSTNPSDADSDDDGLLDGTERTAGSNPFNADTDGDTLTDAEEVNLTHTNPTRADSNSNGTNDAADDQDGDGVPNLAEIRTYGTNPVLADTDGDGISDGAELAMTQNFYKLVAGSFNQAQAAADAATKRGRLASLVELATYTSVVGKARRTSQGYLWVGLSDATAEGTWKWADGTTLNYNRWLSGQPDGGSGENFALIMENASTLADGAAAFVAAGYLYERTGLDPLIPDTDGDGLNDGAEQNTHSTSPFNDDSDSDGLLDGAEVLTHLSNPNKTDTDDDGLTDKQEVETYLTNPAVKDTDSDGFDDLFEINTGFNPRLASSTADAVSTIHTSVEFRFNAANGVSYRIEASTDLNNWASVEDNIIGIGGVVTRFYSIENQPRRFFRVRRN